MKTEYAVGKIRIHFESRARRRWFVAFFYALLAVSVLAGYFVSAKNTTSQWVSAGCMILWVVLWIVFTWVAGDTSARGDEREMHRRDHAHFRAYRFFLYVLLGALLANFRGPKPISPLLPPALRAFLPKLQFDLLLTAFLLYLTLPQAILLWTEPDMESEP